jgi:hypothetical protein
MNKYVIMAVAAFLLSGCGSGSTSTELEALLDYMDRQVDALENDDIDQAVTTARQARYHTEPGNTDGEWVGELPWVSPMAGDDGCLPHLEADGVNDAHGVCRTASNLWSMADDIDYYVDESVAQDFWGEKWDDDEYEFWLEDRKDFFRAYLKPSKTPRK